MRMSDDPKDGPWLDVPNAVEIVAQALSMSAGAGGAALCSACASGMVRWRLIDTFKRPPTREDWTRVHIDTVGNIVRGHTEWDGLFLRISGFDLLYWLRQQPAYKPPRSTMMEPEIASDQGRAAQVPPAKLFRREEAEQIAKNYINTAKENGENPTQDGVWEALKARNPDYPRSRARQIAQKLGLTQVGHPPQQFAAEK